MTIDILIEFAKKYSADAPDSVYRNRHMNRLRDKVGREVTDAVVVDFINFIAMRHGIDLALYVEDIDRTATQETVGKR